MSVLKIRTLKNSDLRLFRGSAAEYLMWIQGLGLLLALKNTIALGAYFISRKTF